VTQAESRSLVEALFASYPWLQPQKATIDMYTKALLGLENEEAAWAIGEAVKRSSRVPSISELIELVVTERLGLETASAAWEMILLDKSERPRPLSGPAERAYRLVGGRHAVRSTDQPGILRAQFLKAYEEFRLEAIRAASGRALGAGDDPRELTS
jgi:hypothetical protein